MNWQLVRAWVYRVTAVLGLVYVAVGVVTGEASYDDLAAAFATMVTALAAANTPTKVVTNDDLAE